MSSERTLPPIRLPFNVQGGEAAPARGPEQPSWGKRLGVWWDDAPEGRGVVVTGVVRGRGAQGEHLEVGDRIVAADGKPIASLGDLTSLLERIRAGEVLFTIRRAGGPERVVTISLRPPAEEQGKETPSGGIRASGSSVAGARVPGVPIEDSIGRYVELILSTPLQSDVLSGEIAADPDFGCQGAGLDFAQATVPHSVLRSAILASEKRLLEVEIDSIEIADPARRGGKRKVGIAVRGKIAATGQPVRFEYKLDDLSAARARSTRFARAGFEEGAAEGEDEGGN
ncbi:MAG: PDZ domain-containing protein [Candidatus Eisenbacteria bacterium]|nr:PDZ domain-containing protein [Candidatus Eisenbacteria bacterium]